MGSPSLIAPSTLLASGGSDTVVASRACPAAVEAPELLFRRLNAAALLLRRCRGCGAGDEGPSAAVPPLRITAEMHPDEQDTQRIPPSQLLVFCRGGVGEEQRHFETETSSEVLLWCVPLRLLTRLNMMGTGLRNSSDIVTLNSFVSTPNDCLWQLE